MRQVSIQRRGDGRFQKKRSRFSRQSSIFSIEFVLVIPKLSLFREQSSQQDAVFLSMVPMDGGGARPRLVFDVSLTGRAGSKWLSSSLWWLKG
jgi:hypothetical protein